MNIIKNIYEFIDIAEKNRKYPTNTAHARRAALRVFEKELSSEELESLDLVEQRLSEIFLEVISKNKDKYSIASLNTYKNRFLKLIDDYKRYGTDPIKLEHWNAKLRNTAKHVDKNQVLDRKLDISQPSVSSVINNPVHKITLSLSREKILHMEIPIELTESDAQLAKRIIDSLLVEKKK